MKIAILTSGILPVPAVQGGAVENLVDFYLEYNDLHKLHDITVYSIWHPDVEVSPALKSDVNHYINIKVNSIWGRIKKYFYQKTHKDGYYHYSIEFFLHETIKHLKHQHYDVIILENRPGYALSLQNLTHAKLVLHQENDYLNSHISNCQQIYDSISLIINTSDYITQQVKTISLQDTKSRTVLNGVDINRFYKAKSQKRAFVELSKNDFIILYSGRLTKEKGILQLIQAIKQVNMPNIHLLIIGASAYGKDKCPTPFIRQIIEETEPIKENIVFTGFVNYQQIPSFLKMADIAVVPSMWEEPFGLTVVEAMAAGLPLITTRSGGIPEICEGVATIVNRDDIVNNLSSAILDLYQHPEKRKAMSQSGIERSRLFDKEDYARNFFAALEEIG